MNIQINQKGVILGPSLAALNKRLNKEVFINVQDQKKIAAVRGLITMLAQDMSPNATVDFALTMKNDGSQFVLSLDLTATGI